MRELDLSELELVFGGDTGSNIPGVSGADVNSYGGASYGDTSDKLAYANAYAQDQARLAIWLKNHPGLTAADYYKY